MKKIIYLGSFVILVICLTGCNKQLFDFKYTYDKEVDFIKLYPYYIPEDAKEDLINILRKDIGVDKECK